MPRPLKHQPISVVIPRTSWSFNLLPGETKEQGLNRFIYSILVDKEGPRKLVETLLKDSYVNGITSEVTASWVDECPSIVDDSAASGLFKYTKADK